MTKTANTQVVFIGGGPIGLTGGLLLAQQGIQCMVVDRRGRTSTHPRSRLVDAATMEIMRQLGLEEEVEATGLGPDWTEYNRWFDGLARTEVARIYTPSFHTVDSPVSPCRPVMTAQDHVEAILFERAAKHDLIDLRFNTLAQDLMQDDDGIRLTLRNANTGEETRVRADYAVGADGVHSATRDVIEAPLEADFMDVFFQDVIFHADFSSFMDGRKGGLLFITHEMGGAVFQPLDGKRRWRCQIGGFPRDRRMTREFAADWIGSAVNREGGLGPIDVKTMTEWQFMPGRAGTFGRGRIFLAGDAAHVFIPTGGLGNNTGFVGIRNLAWKLACVLKGAAPPSLLETYDSEHQEVAKQRVDTGTRIAQLAAGIFRAYWEGEDPADAVRQCAQYGNYNGLIFGYEVKSPLCAVDAAPPPPVQDEVIDYAPVVRSGRRVPHVWLDNARKTSILDWLGKSYVLLLAAGVPPQRWQSAAEAIHARGFPIETKRLPKAEPHAPYASDAVILMRPDVIVADHWADSDVAHSMEGQRIRRYLPLREGALLAGN